MNREIGRIRLHAGLDSSVAEGAVPPALSLPSNPVRHPLPKGHSIRLLIALVGLFTALTTHAFASTPIATWVLGPYTDTSDYGVNVQTTVHVAYVHGRQNEVTALVDADEVCIGGGAYVGGSGNAFLYGSFPFLAWDTAKGRYNGNGWTAQSKEHLYVSTHYLYAYAVGLKLKDRNRFWNTGTGYVPRDVVQGWVQYTMSTGAAANHPTATATVPAGRSIVGGGARVWDVTGETQPANFLTGSYYDSNNGWVASSKDHWYSSPSNISAWAISLPANNHTDTSCPGFGDIRVSYDKWNLNGVPLWQKSVVTSPSTAGTLLLSSYGQDWAPAGAGGYTTYAGYGRMLTAILPTPSRFSVFVGDRDCSSPDSGTLTGQHFALQLDDNNDF